MSTSAAPLVKVLITQPVVPNYRVPFFKSLLLGGRFDITLFAGRSIFWGPKSCKAAHEIADLGHETTPLFGGFLFWQKNLWIPRRFGSGDILVLSGSPRLLNNPFLIVQARLKKMKIVWWGQGWTAGLKPWKILFRRRLMKLVDIVILYTEKEALDYIAAGFDHDRVFGLNNTIDTTEITAIRQQWDTQRLEDFKRSKGFFRPFRLLFVSRLTPKTKLEIALQALCLLPEDQYELLVVGDGPELGACQAAARMLGIESRVCWLGAIYDEKLLAPYYLTASCFVYPGAIGLSLLHAFAYGLPVVTHGDAIGHMPEFSALIDGVNGCTFEQNNPEHLAEKIKAICNDSALLKTLGENALFRVKSEFSMKHMVAIFEQALLRATIP